jgi:hypothetical protein
MEFTSYVEMAYKGLNAGRKTIRDWPQAWIPGRYSVQYQSRGMLWQKAPPEVQSTIAGNWQERVYHPTIFMSDIWKWARLHLRGGRTLE